MSTFKKVHVPTGPSAESAHRPVEIKPWRVSTFRWPRCALPTELTRARAAAAEAKSDLVNVLSSLEAHWHVLEAEVVEINRDIEYCEQCLRKYGEWFNSPLQYLRVGPRVEAQRLTHSRARVSRSSRVLSAVSAGVEAHEKEQNVRPDEPPPWVPLLPVACHTPSPQGVATRPAAHAAASPAHRGKMSCAVASQEGNHSHDGVVQQQPAGGQEAGQGARETDGAPHASIVPDPRAPCERSLYP